MTPADKLAEAVRQLIREADESTYGGLVLDGSDPDTARLREALAAYDAEPKWTVETLAEAIERAWTPLQSVKCRNGATLAARVALGEVKP